MLIPAVVTAGVREPAALFGLACVAFGGGRLVAPFVDRRPALRAAAMVVCLLCAIGGGAWALVAISRPVVDQFRNVDELTPSLAGKTIRVRGYLVPGSMGPKHYSLSFGQKRLRVVDGGALRPDSMRDGMEVMAHGVLQEDGTFQSDSAISRCPDNYDRSKGERPF